MGQEPIATHQGEAALKPVSSFLKQAVIVIHGMGEQMPMDTIKSFVRAVWETDEEITGKSRKDAAEVWSKPDVRTGSLELRRITTRESVSTKTFRDGVRSDFYELYWADLSGGSTWSHVRDWFMGLLVRNPVKRVPRKVFLAWLLLWFLAFLVMLLAAAAALPDTASIGGARLWDYPPLLWLSVFQGWQLVVFTAGIAFVISSFVVPYFGRVVRYTRAKPENIEARKKIRDRGLSLLADLHKSGDYVRVIIVGHSLGSIVAYDLISYFWAERLPSHTVKEGTDEFQALCALEQACIDVNHQANPSVAVLEKFAEAQRQFCRSLRLRPKPPKDKPDDPDWRWLITDLVTVGSPLAHAEFLLANSKDDLESRKQAREFPTAPPVREPLDSETLKKARQAKLPIDECDPRLMCFPIGEQTWQLHHAAPYAAVRWTNIHDPALLVFFGDMISGPVRPVFGPAVRDVNLKDLRGQASVFTHTHYWSDKGCGSDSFPRQITELRQAIDLAGRHREL
jgi:hypothetical protein